MATKAKKATPAKEEKKGKKVLSDAEKAEKRAKMKERLANRPEGQRPNSKQIDVIEFEGGKVMNFAAPVRKFGSLITSVVVDKDGNPISTSVTLIEGFKPKCKKGHGNLVPGTPGMGKKGKGGADAEVEEDED